MQSEKSREYKLEKACIFDLEEIILFEKQVLNDSSEYTSKKNLKRIIKSPNSEILLIKNRENKICSYGIATLRHFKSVSSGHIYKIAVLPEFRRIGLATRIVKELEKFVSRNNMFKAFAEARESNKASLALFEKSGYKRVKTLYGYYSCLNDSFELENGIKLCKVIIKQQ